MDFNFWVSVISNPLYTHKYNSDSISQTQNNSNFITDLVHGGLS